MPVPLTNLTLRRFLLGGAAAALAAANASPPSKNHEPRETAEPKTRELAQPAKYSYEQSLDGFRHALDASTKNISDIKSAKVAELLSICEKLARLNQKENIIATQEMLEQLKKYREEFRVAMVPLLDSKTLSKLTNLEKEKKLNTAILALLQLDIAESSVRQHGALLRGLRESLRPAIRNQAKQLEQDLLAIIKDHHGTMFDPGLKAAWKGQIKIFEKKCDLTLKVYLIENKMSDDEVILEGYRYDKIKLDKYRAQCIKALHSYDRGEEITVTANEVLRAIEARADLFRSAQSPDPIKRKELEEYIQEEGIFNTDKSNIQALRP